MLHRPGLSNFLKEIEALYELHIYTMGTRSYAEAVAKEIDATGSLFKERILSRDESGSKTICTSLYTVYLLFLYVHLSRCDSKETSKAISL